MVHRAVVALLVGLALISILQNVDAKGKHGKRKKIVRPDKLKSLGEHKSEDKSSRHGESAKHKKAKDSLNKKKKRKEIGSITDKMKDKLRELIKNKSYVKTSEHTKKMLSSNIKGKLERKNKDIQNRNYDRKNIKSDVSIGKQLKKNKIKQPGEMINNIMGKKDANVQKKKKSKKKKKSILKSKSQKRKKAKIIPTKKGNLQKKSEKKQLHKKKKGVLKPILPRKKKANIIPIKKGIIKNKSEKKKPSKNKKYILKSILQKGKKAKLTPKRKGNIHKKVEKKPSKKRKDFVKKLIPMKKKNNILQKKKSNLPKKSHNRHSKRIKDIMSKLKQSKKKATIKKKSSAAKKDAKKKKTKGKTIGKKRKKKLPKSKKAAKKKKTKRPKKKKTKGKKKGTSIGKKKRKKIPKGKKGRKNKRGCGSCDNTQVCHRLKNGRGRCVCAPGYRVNPVRRGGTCLPLAQCPTKTVTFCDDDRRPVISCPTGSYIQLSDANYGRTKPNKEACPAKTKNQRTDCTSQKSGLFIKLVCNGLEKCSLKKARGFLKNIYTGPCKKTAKYIEVTYACVTPGNQCKLPCVPSCGENEHCVTRPGPTGQLESNCECIRQGGNKCGRKCLNPSSLSCFASGDPHFRTFDQGLIHFQGTCRYVLSRTINSSLEHPFQVLVENEHRNGKTKVSFVKKVIVKFNGIEVRFNKNGRVSIDGKQQVLPVVLPGFKITRQKNVIKLVTDFGLTVEYDGRHKAGVTVTPNYCQELEGICGNINGIKDDDYVTRKGLDVSKSKNKYAKIGNSWQVKTDEVCESVDSDINPPKETAPECVPLENLDEDNFMLPCLNNADDLAKEYLESCNYDMHELMGQTDEQKHERACDLFSTFIEECVEHIGQDMDEWEDELQCTEGPNGFPTTTLVPESPCDPTCKEPKTCKEVMPGVHQCKCPQGLVENKDGKCIEPGCNPRCDDTKSCDNQGDKPPKCKCKKGLVQNPKDKKGKCIAPGSICNLPCDETKKCKIFKGKPRCVCEDGYTLNPLNKEGKCLVKKCKPRCGRNEQCRQGVCVCKAGSVKTPQGKCINKKPICDLKCDDTKYCKLLGNKFPRCVCKDGYKMNPLNKKGKCLLKKCKPKCDKNQLCKEGVCVCKDGFVKTPQGKCVNKKPICDLKCDNTKYCKLLGNKFPRCVCKDGYKMNPLNKKGKCLLKKCKPKCDKNQLCKEGVCVCKDGFVKTPQGKCVNKKPVCDLKCDETRYCKLLSNKVPRCVCKDGYTMNPLNREGKCLQKCKPKCGKNEKCVQGVCVCKPGYVKTPKGKCLKKPKCEAECDETKKCKEFPKGSGMYRCVCIKGLGRNPEDPNGKCIKPGCDPKCGKNMRCKEKGKGRFFCVCKDGFVKVPGQKTCKSKKKKGCDPKCLPTQQCKRVSKKTYKCLCKKGFTEGIDGRCLPDKCKGRCHITQVCKEINKKTSRCECADGYQQQKNKKKSKGKRKCVKQVECDTTTAVFCDEDGKKRLSCPVGSTIQVVYANYGRTQTDVCPSNKPKQSERVDCVWPISERIVKRVCQGYNQCTLKIKKGVFTKGCKGTKKYLEVQYSCVTNKDQCVVPCEPPCGDSEHCRSYKDNDGTLSAKCECIQEGSPKCGKKCLNPSSLRCFASGDPHYRTFDNKIIHFMGTCRYLLTGTKAGSTEHPFKILVENEHRKKNKKVAWTKAVTIKANGAVIRMNYGGRVKIDGVRQNIFPVTSVPGITITRKVIDTYVYLNLVTTFGLSVEYYENKLAVTVTPNYCQELDGICGNINGNPLDDYFTKSGEDVTTKKNRYSLIGNSWKVNSGDLIGCLSPDEDITTPSETPDECKPLEDTESDNILLPCLMALENTAEEYLENCKVDVDEQPISRPDNRKKVACEILDAFVEECEIHLQETIGDWKTELQCSADPCGGACNKHTQVCKPFRPGRHRCMCIEGFRMDPDDNSNCIPKDDCFPKCDDTKQCKKVQGLYKCECNRGLDVNPVDSSRPCIKPRCKPKCDDTTQMCKRLVNGLYKCMCKRGYKKRDGACILRDTPGELTTPSNPGERLQFNQ